MNDLERKKMQQRSTARKIKAAAVAAAAAEGSLLGLAAETPKKADAMDVVQPAAAAQQSTAVKATPAAITAKANSSTDDVDATPLYNSAVRQPASAAAAAVRDAPAPAAPDLDLVDMCNDDSDHDDSSSVEEVMVDSVHVSAAQVDVNGNPERGNVFDEPPEYNEAHFARPVQQML
jgi:hypothetical protein